MAAKWHELSIRTLFVLTQAVRTVYGEAHEDDIGVWVGEGSQPVVVLLPRSVPESQLHLRIWGEREKKRGTRKGGQRKDTE